MGKNKKVYPFTIGIGAHFCKLWGFPVPGAMYSKDRMLYLGQLENGDYDFDGHEDQKDWNKLPGFSANGINHKFCSQRAGWRWDLEKGMYEFQPYIYDNGSRVFNPPSTPSMFVPVNQYTDKSRLFVIDLQDQYTQWEMRMALCNIGVTMNDFRGRKDVDFSTLITWHTDKVPTTNPVRIACYPYFGGQKKAVKRINAPIKFLDADSDLLDKLSGLEDRQKDG